MYLKEFNIDENEIIKELENENSVENFENC